LSETTVTNTAPGISFVQNDYNYANGLRCPSTPNGSGPAYYGPNLEFTREPGFYGLLALGLTGSLVAVRRPEDRLTRITNRTIEGPRPSTAGFSIWLRTRKAAPSASRDIHVAFRPRQSLNDPDRRAVKPRWKKQHIAVKVSLTDSGFSPGLGYG
jgi:hypothetical protein